MILKKFPLQKQFDQMDCGPTCLQMIAQYYGRYYSLHQLRARSAITREGVSLLGISEAAETVGFRTVGVKISFDKLTKDAPLPVIVHWYQRHFVVVYKIARGKVYVADPAQGFLKYTEKEFCKGWMSIHANGHSQGIALLLEPQPAFFEHQRERDDKARWENISFLLGYMKRHRRLIGQLILGLLTGSLIQLALPFLTQSIVDVGIQTQNIKFIYLVLAGQTMLFVSRSAVEFIRRWILLHLSTRINISIVSDFLTKLFRLSVSFFESKMIGDILRRVEDHARIERFISSSSLNILFSLFNLLLFSLVLVVYDIPIFFVFVSFSVVYVLYVMLFMKRRAELDYKRFQETANNQSNLIQTIQGMTEIKMNNCETEKRWEWERIQARLFHVNVAGMRLQQWQDAGSTFLNESKNMLITVMAALSVIDGGMTLGMMLAVQYIIGQLNAPVNDFVAFVRDWQDARISLERIGEIHKLENEEKNDLVALQGVPKNKTIVVENLSFQYDGSQSSKVLDRVDLIIPEKKVTAIVGASGSGKTTLMKLLLKFYSPCSGKIIVGGENLSQISHALWRGQCGAVMQDGYIFSDTIFNNIALTTPSEIDRERLLHAVTVAHINDFIDSLPLGYNTKIGMNGVGLSQGQKQRLLIARAVYKNPQVIFFDEATSALDANNEKVIMDNLNMFFKNKTVVVIAHRLSTVKNADQIVVLENGKLVETGNHVSLSQTKGKYYQLVKNQLELST